MVKFPVQGAFAPPPETLRPPAREAGRGGFADSASSRPRTGPRPSSLDEVAAARAQVKETLLRFGREAPARTGRLSAPPPPGSILDIRV